MTPASLFGKPELPTCSVCHRVEVDPDLYELDRCEVCLFCYFIRYQATSVALMDPLAMRPEALARLIEAHEDVVTLEYTNGIVGWRWTSEWPGVAA